MKVSIITPFYNSERYLSVLINSILQQTYKNWELILINDGSFDNSKNIALSYKDSRITYLEQENQGVSNARNFGLAKMTGDYFCFVDSDDMLPSNSLSSRLSVFNQFPELTFVDGKVERRDSKLLTIESIWYPSFKGNPFKELIKLNGSCFFGPSWMIRRNSNKTYQFHEELSHGEDLLFFMELAREGGLYSFTEETILHYRNTPDSAMKNLKELEKGYRFIFSQIKLWPEVSNYNLNAFKARYKKAMSLAYIQRKDFENAFKVWI